MLDVVLPGALIAALLDSEDGLDEGPAADADGVDIDGRLVCPWPCVLFRAGVVRSVDKLMISFPCTIRLSLDFLRSLVSIAVIVS